MQVEEGMRVQYERKRQYLRYLSERGAEAEKLEAVETSIRKLSTKIRISIKVVSTISNKINQLRDGELWLRVCEIIRGYVFIYCVLFYLFVFEILLVDNVILLKIKQCCNTRFLLLGCNMNSLCLTISN